MSKVITGLKSIASAATLVVARANKSKAAAAWAVKQDPRNLSAKFYNHRLKGADVSIMTRFALAAELSGVLDTKNAQFLHNNFCNSQSQILQDLICLMVTQQKTNGYFVEVGVGNGVDISNTYLLETAYDWAGLLVEPNRSSHENIAANRKATLDKRAASSEMTGQLEFAENIAEGEFSKIVSQEGDRAVEGSVYYKVDIASLDQILQDAGAPKQIDFISLDTEGTEIDILKSVDLKTYTFGFMAIEHNAEPGKIEALEALLKPYGYHRILTSYSLFDGWFVHDSLISLAGTDPALTLRDV